MRTVLVTIVGPADRQRSAGAAVSGDLAPRRDLSLPADVPLGELLPTLVRLFGALGGGSVRAQESWGLVDPNGSPLDTRVSLGANGVLNGALLQLQPGNPAHGDPSRPDFGPQAEQPPIEWPQPAEPTPLPASRSANRWRDTFVALAPPSDQQGEPAPPPAAPVPAASLPAAAQPPEVAPHPSPRPDAGADFEPVVPIGNQRLWGAPSPFSVVDRPPDTGGRRDPPVTDDRSSTGQASVYHMDARRTSTPPAHRGTTAHPAAANPSALDTAAIDPPAVQPSAIDPYAVHPAAVDRGSAGPAAARPAIAAPAAPAAPDPPAQSAVAPGSDSGGWFASPATNGQAAATNGSGRATTRPPSEQATPLRQNGTGTYPEAPYPEAPYPEAPYPEAPEPSARAAWTGNGSSQWAWGGPDSTAPRARQAPGQTGPAAPPDGMERASYLRTGHPGTPAPPGQPRGRQAERGPAADRPVPGPGPRARSGPLERARRAWRSADYPRHLDAGIVAPRLRRGVTIAVISPKPGTGRTLVATLLAATLVELRPDQVRVVAGGTASGRSRGRRGAARQQNQGQQHGSFEQFAGRLPGHAPVPDPDPFPDSLSETGGGGLTPEAEAVALGGVVLVDCAAGLDGSPARTAIGLADQLVLVTDADPATGSLAVEAATPLLEAGRSVTIVVNQRPLRGRRLDVSRLDQMLPLAGGPVVVSYEPAAGAALDEGRFDLREAPSGWRRAGRELAYIVTADWRTRGYAR